MVKQLEEQEQDVYGGIVQLCLDVDNGALVKIDVRYFFGTYRADCTG